MSSIESKTSNIEKIFSYEAKKIEIAREMCKYLHDTNIKAAGNEVEYAIRDFFKRMLPSRFNVSHGHLIDRDKIISPELDIIISDNTTIPSLVTSKDKTDYIPIDSVYAIAEIKSTFYRSNKDITKFSETLKYIREKMKRPLVENTAYEMLTTGKGPKSDTLIRDMILGKPNKYLNPLYSFMIFVNSGDIRTGDIEQVFTVTAPENLPCLTVLLNYACVAYGKIDEKGFGFNKYPGLNHSQDYSWFITSSQGRSSTEGNHLGLLYYALLNHLNESFLEIPNLSPYLADMLIGRASSMIEIRKSKNDIDPSGVENS